MIECLISLGLSMHMGFEYDYNQIHPNFRCTQEQIFAGVFLNSENKVSIYTGVNIFENIEVGMITGYTDYKITPMIRWKKDNWFVMPGIENGRQVGIVFGLEIPIGD